MSRACPKCGHWKMADIEGHKHTGHLCYWCGHHEYQEANPVSEKEPTPTDPIPPNLREAVEIGARASTIWMNGARQHPAPDWETLPAIVQNAYREQFTAALRALLAGGWTVERPKRQWRHVTRGTVYTEVCNAELQAATGAPREGDELVIYRGEDGYVWARSLKEFADGRFESIPSAPKGAADER